MECVHQRLRLLQILGVKPFGEPVVHIRQQLVSVGGLALTLPQASEACRGAQFPGLGLLLLGDVDGFEEAGFGLFGTMNAKR